MQGKVMVRQNMYMKTLDETSTVREYLAKFLAGTGKLPDARRRERSLQRDPESFASVSCRV